MRATPAAAEPWRPDELAVLDELVSPWKIQEFLNGLAYSADPVYRCPRSVLRDRKAHCVDGALMAAAALRRLGFAPVIAELRAEPGLDDDHLLALFWVDGHLGAVAKSNTTVLRYREPVFRSLRELAMSYFEFYFNIQGVKALRSHSAPLQLERFDRLGWMTRDEAVDVIIERLDCSRHYDLLSPAMIRGLAPVDRAVYEAGLLGADWQGLFDPAKHGRRED